MPTVENTSTDGQNLSANSISHEYRESSIVAECLDCGHRTFYTPTLITCSVCNSEWLEARYDYKWTSQKLLNLLIGRPFNLWRYRELLPIYEYNPGFSMGEGGTPLIHAKNFGLMLGCSNIYIKDERQSPTSSFKDRQAAVNIAALKEIGVNEFVLASTGNVAIAYSAYAARAGIKLWAFLTSMVPAEKMREVAVYGAQVIKVTSSYDQTKKIAEEFAQQRGLLFERGSRSIPSVEAMKTIAFEIAEQLAIPNNQTGIGWMAPDWYFQSISGGLGPLGVMKGFEELLQMGLVEKIPALGGIQVEGCAPMVHAWKAGKEQAEPIVSPRTHIATLTTGDPGRTYTLLYRRMKKDGKGVFESTSDEETFRAMHILAQMEGISVEPAAAVAFAGLIKLVRAGVINPTDLIVINCTGHTMPIEKAILGDLGIHSMVIPSYQKSYNAKELKGAQVSEDLIASSEEEGLLAALNRITPEYFSSRQRSPLIMIVDDSEEARRLIHRILLTRGKYTIIEAENGKQAIEMARSELPDLVLLDLMMPELDGFAVIDALKEHPTTSSIPVIVITAKELSVEEKQRLNGQIQSLMQKGEFISVDLLEEVRSLVK